MTIESTCAIKEYLKRLSSKDFRLDLGPMREACLRLGNPQESYASVHIVGTNGKGSTAAFLSSLLQASGYRVGLMTSPHLVEVGERIQINRDPISWEALSGQVCKIREGLPEENFLSYFEMVTLAGFDYFAERGVEIAVVEAGLGGRLDATNVLKPSLAIFTPIAFDHEQYLGDSLAKIAGEKCGILKPGMTVITAPQPEEAAMVIEEACQTLGLELVWADPLEVDSPLGLKGRHQKMNAACALAAAKQLIADDTLLSVGAKALGETKWPGRLDYLCHNPTLLVDGGHNLAGIQTLATYLRENHGSQTIHFVVGALRDKNWETMFSPLAPLASRFLCVTPDTERGLQASDLAFCLQSLGKPVEALKGPICKQWPQILSNLSPPDLCVATGSLYVVGETLSCFPKHD